MDWMQAPDSETPFVDAARIFKVLDGASCAPNLYSTAANKFAPSGAPDTCDQEAFDYLLREGFVQVPIELRNNIDSFIHLDSSRDATRTNLKAVYRKSKTLTVQLKKVEKELDSSGFLTSKKALWERRSRQDTLKQELEELTHQRRRMESDLEKAGTLLKDLLNRIYRDQPLREGAFFAGRPVLLTGHGRFLHDYLSEMNPAHFKGRSLAEILEIGPALA